MQGLKMSGKPIFLCAALLLTLTSVYAARRSLNCINDLTTYLQYEHTNILQLLHWFANEVDLDYDDIVLPFDLHSGYYGSHYYRNEERLLEPLPLNYHYYTIGNINQATSSFPPYVVNYAVMNTARIVVRLNERRLIDQVYFTQHYSESENHGSRYDPDNTYRITTCCLRQLRKYTIDEIQQLADCPQTGPSTNSSVTAFQNICYPEKETRIDIVGSQGVEHNDLQTCVISCVVVFFLVFFIVLVILWSYLSNGNK